MFHSFRFCLYTDLIFQTSGGIKLASVVAVSTEMSFLQSRW